MATKDALNITMAKRTRRMTRTSDLTAQWRDASTAASAGTVPSEVSAVSILLASNWPRRKRRQKCTSTHSTSGIVRADALRIGATGRCRSGALPSPTSAANNDAGHGGHFLALPFFRANTHFSSWY